ncbi:MAG: LapA family protein [Halieaceae bacterium]|jgi:uncharacterized integral membrane protein|nr:LapA family protein [Halieaceae bacterium]
MQYLRNLFYFLIAVAMLALGALFAVQNEATVPLDLLVVYLPERSVALWVLLAFAVGGVAGLLASLGIILRQRTALASARRKLDKLRAQASQDSSPKSTPAPEPAAVTAGDKTAQEA